MTYYSCHKYGNHVLLALYRRRRTACIDAAHQYLYRSSIVPVLLHFYFIHCMCTGRERIRNKEKREDVTDVELFLDQCRCLTFLHLQKICCVKTQKLFRSSRNTCGTCIANCNRAVFLRNCKNNIHTGDNMFGSGSTQVLHLDIMSVTTVCCCLFSFFIFFSVFIGRSQNNFTGAYRHLLYQSV